MTNDNSNPQQGAVYHPARRGPPHRRDERKLFVGGLPANITSDEFREFFGKFGLLVDSVVMFDRETQRSRGFGFVTYDDPSVCHQILMMGNEGADPKTAMSLVGKVEMQGKICEVKAATPREGGRGRRDESKNILLLTPDPAVPAGPTPSAGMYGYPPTTIGYPPNMLPPALMFYPPPYATQLGYTPYMDYLQQQNGYGAFTEYQPPFPVDEAMPQTGISPAVIPVAPLPPAQQLQYPVVAMPQHAPLMPVGGTAAAAAAVLVHPQPALYNSSMPPPDPTIPLPYLGVPTSYAGVVPPLTTTSPPPTMEHLPYYHSHHHPTTIATTSINGQQKSEAA